VTTLQDEINEHGLAQLMDEAFGPDNWKLEQTFLDRKPLPMSQQRDELRKLQQRLGFIDEEAA
jgi:hypothetical protein